MALLPKARPGEEIGKASAELSSRPEGKAGAFSPTAAQWAALTIEPVQELTFRPELLTDGKIAVDETRSTPVFSPYSGRVTKITAEPGDTVQAGQLLFALEATDMVQAQNDFIAAVAGLETARSQLHLAQIVEKRQHDLYEGKAVPLKDWQQAQADLVTAQDNVRTAEIALEAVRNRLRILQKTEDEIAAFERTGRISPDTPIYAPIGGTVVQRKVGPGQYITSGASDPAGDPVFVIGDLSTVWLVANVRESDVLKMRPGQPIQFRCWPPPSTCSPGNSTMSRPQWMRIPGVSWCELRSRIRKNCSSRKCSRASPSSAAKRKRRREPARGNRL